MKRWFFLLVPFGLFCAVVLVPRPALAALHFCNNTPFKVYVAVATDDGAYSSNANDDWVSGWDQVPAGTCNADFNWAIETWKDVYFYVQSDVGQTWSGYMEYCVNSSQAFTYYDPAKDTCDLSSAKVGFRYIPSPTADYTVNLSVGAQADEQLGSSDNWLKCMSTSLTAAEISRACLTLVDYAASLGLSGTDISAARLHDGRALTQMMNDDLGKSDYKDAEGLGVLAQSQLQLTSPLPTDDLATASQVYGVALMADQKYSDAVSEESYALRLSSSVVSYHAYWVRGRAYLGLEKPQEAYDDETAALSAGGSKIAGVYEARADAELDLMRNDDALTDVQNAITLDPSDLSDYALRGKISFAEGQYANAAYDLRRGIGDDPAYDALWIFLAQAHLHKDAAPELAHDTASITSWPAPVIAFYLGHSTRAGLLSAAKDGDSQKQADQLCEAAFYLGEWELLHGAKAVARTDLHRAAQTCPAGYSERSGALSELARMH